MDSAVEPADATNEESSLVDPFLVEALQNPRFRITILRMELDVQRFLRNLDLQQFEFQQFPTSYLRLAAHRVAQHYGLVTTVQGSGSDGLGNRILVRKTAESRYPSVRLSEIPTKQSETNKLGHIKIAIKTRPNRGSIGEAYGTEVQQNPVRSVEERKEEYDRARARIFSNSGSLDSKESSQAIIESKNTCLSRNEGEVAKNSSLDAEKKINLGGGDTSYRVAASFRDREKDRFDPDYNRSYERYVRIMPTGQNFSPAPIQGPFYETSFPQTLRTRATMHYRHSVNPIISPYCTAGQNQTLGDANVHMQWPNFATVYAHSYEQFRHAAFQAPFRHQPLSFEYLQNR